MGHPKIDNATAFSFEPVFIADEDLRPIVVTIVKASYSFDESGRLDLSDEQASVNFDGERWGDSDEGSYKYEPEIAPCKPTTDVVLIGHAHPAVAGDTFIDVGIKVGPVQKVARVFGDRFWVQTNAGVRMTSPAPMELVPLSWENAFGGQDTLRSTSDCLIVESRNPVGTGFGQPLQKEGDRLRLPNIENASQLIREYGEVVTPWGFGFTAPHWQPRAGFSGTYDEQWERTRSPLLPTDFDRRFFNAAAPGLISAEYLRGDEDVVLLNVRGVPRVSFRLPGLRPPSCKVVLRGSVDMFLETNLDTVIVNADDLTLTLLWRAWTHIGGGPHDVTAIAISPAS